MKTHMTNFLKIKKGVKSFTAKIFTVGNLKRVISFVLLLSMLISSNAVSTLASTKPKSDSSSETVEDTNTTAPNEGGEFFAEGENSDELNGIDEDIEVEAVGAKHREPDGEYEENENTENAEDAVAGENPSNAGAKYPVSDGEYLENENKENKSDDTVETNPNTVGEKHREPDGEYEENENTENAEDAVVGANENNVGANHWEPADDNENNDNEVVGANENNVGAKHREPDETNEENENIENAEDAVVGANPNDVEVKYPVPDINTIDNGTAASPSTASEASIENNDDETKIDENITNYIDLFIKNQKSGITENNWKIVKVLMQGTDERQEISVPYKEEQEIKEALLYEELLLSPIVSVVISDDYGLKKVVVVPAVWKNIYNEKEVIESIKNEDNNAEISFQLDKDRLIKEVEAAISSGVDKYENYTGKEELSSIYMPAEIANSVLRELYDRSYEALKLEGIIKEENEKEDTEETNPWDPEVEHAKNEVDEEYSIFEADAEYLENENIDSDDMKINNDESSAIHVPNRQNKYGNDGEHGAKTDAENVGIDGASLHDDISGEKVMEESHSFVPMDKSEIEYVENENIENDEINTEATSLQDDLPLQSEGAEEYDENELKIFTINNYIKDEEVLGKVIENYKTIIRKMILGSSEQEVETVARSKKLGAVEDNGEKIEENEKDGFELPNIKRGIKYGEVEHTPSSGSHKYKNDADNKFYETFGDPYHKKYSYYYAPISTFPKTPYYISDIDWYYDEAYYYEHFIRGGHPYSTSTSFYNRFYIDQDMFDWNTFFVNGEIPIPLKRGISLEMTICLNGKNIKNFYVVGNPWFTLHIYNCKNNVATIYSNPEKSCFFYSPNAWFGSLSIISGGTQEFNRGCIDFMPTSDRLTKWCDVYVDADDWEYIWRETILEPDKPWKYQCGERAKIGYCGWCGRYMYGHKLPNFIWSLRGIKFRAPVHIRPGSFRTLNNHPACYIYNCVFDYNDFQMNYKSYGRISVANDIPLLFDGLNKVYLKDVKFMNFNMTNKGKTIAYQPILEIYRVENTFLHSDVKFINCSSGLYWHYGNQNLYPEKIAEGTYYDYGNYHPKVEICGVSFSDCHQKNKYYLVREVINAKYRKYFDYNPYIHYDPSRELREWLNKAEDQWEIGYGYISGDEIRELRDLYVPGPKDANSLMEFRLEEKGEGSALDYADIVFTPRTSSTIVGDGVLAEYIYLKDSIDIVQDFTSAKVYDCTLRAPAINIENNSTIGSRLIYKSRNYTIERYGSIVNQVEWGPWIKASPYRARLYTTIQAVASVRIQNNTCNYNINPCYIDESREYSPTSYPVGMRLNGTDTRIGGSLVIKDNTLASVEGIFNYDTHFKTFIHTTDDPHVIRPTSLDVIMLRDWYNITNGQLEIGRTKAEMERGLISPWIILEPPKFPDRYMSAAGISSYRDYFAGLTFSLINYRNDTWRNHYFIMKDHLFKLENDDVKRCGPIANEGNSSITFSYVYEDKNETRQIFGNVTKDNRFGREGCIVLKTHRSNNNDEYLIPNYLYEIYKDTPEKYDGTGLYWVDDPNSPRPGYVQRIYGDDELKKQYSWAYLYGKEGFFYPDNDFPIREARANFNNHNPLMPFKFQVYNPSSRGYGPSSMWFPGDYSAGNKDYIIEYRLSAPDSMEWKSVLGNGQETSIIQYATIDKSITLFDKMWTIQSEEEEVKQIGWTLTEGSDNIDFELREKLTKGIPGAAIGSKIILYPVWNNATHTHSLCGCIKNRCNHSSEIKTEFLNNGIDLNEEVLFEGVTKISDIVDNGNFYLKQNIVEKKTITVNGTLNLCLRGKKIEGVSFEGSGKVNIVNCFTKSNATLKNDSVNIFSEDLTVNIIQKLLVEVEVKRTEADEYIKDVKILKMSKQTAKSTFDSKGYVMLETNLNQGTDGAELYLGYQMTTNKSEAIWGIGERWFNDDGRNPKDFTGLSNKDYVAITDFDGNAWNLNEGCSEGNFVYLYKTTTQGSGYPVSAVEVIASNTSKSLYEITETDKYEAVVNATNGELADFNRGVNSDRIYIRYMCGKIDEKNLISLKSRIIVKCDSLAFGKKAVVCGAELSSSSSSVNLGQAVHYGENYSGWTISETNISGYRGNGENILYDFSNVKFIGDINISGENRNYPLVALNENVNIEKSNIKIANSKVERAGMLSIGNGVAIKNSSIDISGNTIVAGNIDIAIVDYSSDGAFDISNDVKLNISNNKITENNFSNRIFAAMRFGSSQSIKAGNTTIKVKDNKGNSNGVMYQVYSENSEGFIELVEGAGGKLSKDTEMTVAFSTDDGSGTIVTNWNEETVEDVTKYREMFKADTNLYKNLIVNEYKIEEMVVIENMHTHLLCGVKEGCSISCKEIGEEHTTRYKYKAINALSDINNESRAFSLSRDISNQEVAINNEVSLCLSGYSLTNVTFTGSGILYLVNCEYNGEPKESKLTNVKIGDNLKIYVMGRKGITVNGVDGYFINTNREIGMYGVDGNFELKNNANFIEKASKVVIEKTSLKAKVDSGSKLIKSADDFYVSGLSINNSTFNGEIISVGNDVKNIYIVGDKFEIKQNTINSNKSPQGIVEVTDDSSIYFKGAGLELINNQYSNYTDLSSGILSGIYLTKSAYLDFTEYGYVKSRIGEKIGAGIYSENVKAFMRGNETDNKMDVDVLFTNRTNGRGLIMQNNKLEQVGISFNSVRENEGLVVYVTETKDIRIGIPGEAIDRKYRLNYQRGVAKGRDGSIRDISGPDNYIKEVESLGGVITFLNKTENPYMVDGFELVGWSPYKEGVDENGKSDITKPGEGRAAFEEVEDDEEILIYAIWEQKTYTIKYRSEVISVGGSDVIPKGEHPDQIAYYRDSVVLSTNLTEENAEIIKAAGFKVVGWVSENGYRYNVGEVVEDGINNDLSEIILTAVWANKKYNLEFKSGREDIIDVTIRDGEYEYYENIDLRNMYPEQETVDFVGWTITKIYDADGKDLVESEILGKRFTGNSEKGLVDIDGARIVLTAVWKNLEYEITYNKGRAIDFNGNEHEVKLDEGIVVSNTLAELNENVKLNENYYYADGFAFMGWSLQETDTTGTLYQPLVEIPSLATKRGVVPVFAIWKEVEYSIEYTAGYTTTEKMDDDTGSYFADERLKRNTYEAREGTVANGWKVKKVRYKDKNGVEVEEVISPEIVLIGSNMKKSGLTERDGSVVVLEVNWMPVDANHTHKVCGVTGSCNHLGDSHSSNYRYTAIAAIEDLTRRVADAYSGSKIYVFLTQITGEEDKITELTVPNNVELNICLAGNMLQNIEINGEGIVNLSNCKDMYGEIEINHEDNNLSMFSGVYCNIYGGKEKIKITTSKTNIAYIFNKISATVLYNVDIQVEASGIATFALNSFNVWDTISVHDCDIDEFVINDSRMVLKDCVVEKVVSEGNIFYNTDITFNGDNYINNNTVSSDLFDIRTIAIDGNLDIKDNTANTGNILKVTKFTMTQGKKLDINGNTGRGRIVSIVASQGAGNVHVALDTDILITKNRLITANNYVENNAIFWLDYNGEAIILGNLDISNNYITTRGIGLRLVDGNSASVIKLGNGYLNVKNNRSESSTGQVVEVLANNSNGFLETYEGCRFDTTKSSMTVAFTNVTLGTIYKEFTNQHITQGKDAREEYKKVFNADTGLHNYNLLSVILEEDDVKIVTVQGYRIVYRGGIARKHRGGTVEVEGDEYSQDVRSIMSTQVLSNNRFEAKQFRFVGWTPIENISYSEEKVVAFMAGSPIPDLDYARKTINGVDVVYLYGLWEEYTYKIEYESGHEAAQGKIETQEPYYYDSVIIRASNFIREHYKSASWEVVRIIDKNGNNVSSNNVQIGNTFRPRDEVREWLGVNGGTVVLRAVWTYVDDDGSHKHKDCGQINELDCEHTGVAQHRSNSEVYAEWRDTDSVEQAITRGQGYYYLGTDITKNTDTVITVRGKLVICLNGFNLTGVRFQATGSSQYEVVITNCQEEKAVYTNLGSNNVFTGVKGRIYGKTEIDVVADRIINGNGFKAINATFTQRTTGTKSNSVIVGNGVEFALAKVKFVGYKTTQMLISLSDINANEVNVDEYITEFIVEGGEFSNLVRLDNSKLTINTMSVSGVDVRENIFKIENSTALQFENDIAIEDNYRIGEGVINLINQSITNVKMAKVSIRDNKNLKYAIRTAEGTKWISQVDSEINVVGNEFVALNGLQGAVEMYGTIEAGGQINISENTFLVGTGEKAGLLVGSKGLLEIGDANIKVIGNLSDGEIHQVYSLRNDGFMKTKSNSKFKLAESDMEIALADPYTGVVYNNFNEETVLGLNEIDPTERIRAETGGVRKNLSTMITIIDGEEKLIIGKSLAGIKYNLVYNVGEGIGSNGEKYSPSDSSITYNDVEGERIKLKPDNTFTLEGFRIVGWKSSINDNQYEPNAEVSLIEMGVEDSGITITFTAIWVEKTYNIRYNTDDEGATLSVTDDINVGYYKSIELSTDAVEKENCYIKSWKITKVLNKSGNDISYLYNMVGNEYNPGAKIQKFINEDGATIIFTAILEETKVLFSFTINGSIASDGNSKTPSQTSVPSQSIGMGNKITFTDDGAKMKGFTLVGYTNGTKTFKLNTAYDVSTDNFKINIDNNNNYTVNLVSVWEENKYTLKLTKNTDSLISGSDVSQELKYYQRYVIGQTVFRKPGYRINRWKVNKINNVGDTAIDTALANGQITARYYVMPDDTNSITDLPVSQLLDIKDGSIELIAELENTHKHYTNGKGQDTSGNVGKFAYEPLTQGGVSALKTAFYDADNPQSTKMGFFFLTEDIKLTDDMPVNGYAGICLNGYDLDMDGHSFINKGMMYIYICSCRRTEKPGNGGQVIVYDGTAYTDRQPAFDNYTYIYIYAYTLDGGLGYVNINVTPFGTGMNTSTGPNVQTTRENNMSNRRSNAMGSSSSSGEAELNSSGEAPINSRGEPLGARVQDSSDNRRGEPLGARVQDSSDSRRGEVPRAQLQDSSNFKSNLETTKNILNMLYAVSVNNILTDSKVYDSGNFIDANGKLQYIIDDDKLRNGIYKIKIGNKINIYSFDRDGNIETGIKVINGESYFFKETGEMAINEKVRYGNVEYEVNDLGIIKNRIILQL